MDDDWPESDEEAEVQVLVLSPRCWTVSSFCFLDEPMKYFPAELCSYLNQFTQFYTHSQCLNHFSIAEVELQPMCCSLLSPFLVSYCLCCIRGRSV